MSLDFQRNVLKLHESLDIRVSVATDRKLFYKNLIRNFEILSNPGVNNKISYVNLMKLVANKTIKTLRRRIQTIGTTAMIAMSLNLPYALVLIISLFIASGTREIDKHLKSKAK